MALTGKQLKTLQDGDTAYWLTRPLQAILAVRESHSLQRLNEVAMALAVAKPVKTDERPPEAAGTPAFSVNASAPDPDSTSLRAKAANLEVSNCFEPVELSFPDAPQVNQPWWCEWITCRKDSTARQVALGWMLSRQEMELMDAQAAAVASDLARKYP